MVAALKMFVLGAPEELEALVGLFGKLYVSTFDCATFYCRRIQHQEVGNIFANDTPPQVWNWKNRLHIPMHIGGALGGHNLETCQKGSYYTLINYYMIVLN